MLNLKKANLKNDLNVILILTILAFVIFFPTYLNLNFFWDDEKYVFTNPDVLNAKSFFDFWIPGKFEYRTWSLGYSIFWLLNKFISFRPILIFKSINILIHIFNSFLVGKIFNKIFHKKKYLVYSLLFLIHPLHVETVSWIFQLLTLMATTAFLISFLAFHTYYNKQDVKFLYLSYFFFFCSLQIKSIMIFGSFLFLMFYWLKNNLKKSLIPVTPYFIISFLIGMISLGNAQRYIDNSKYKIDSQNPKVLSNFGISDPKQNEISVKKQQDINHYVLLFGNIELTEDEKNFKFNRAEVFTQSAWYYLKNTLLPLDNFFLYPKEKITFFKLGTIFIFSIVLPLLFYLKSNKKIILAIPIIFYITLLPFIGTTLVPFFLWSYVSDHYAYATCFIIPLIFYLMEGLKYKYMNWFLIFFFCLYTLSNVKYGLAFNNPTKLYERISEFKLHPRILSLLFQEYLEKGDLDSCYKTLNLAMKNFPNTQTTKDMQKQFEIFKLNFNN